MTRDLPDEVFRRRAAALAGHRGDAARARVFLDDPVPAVRATALGAIARAGALTAAVLGSALADGSPVVRARAAELAAGLPGDEAPQLVPVLSDADPRVVEAAAWASGERQPTEPGVVTALATVTTGHEDPLCREAAVAALGSIGDAAGLPAILAATSYRPAVSPPAMHSSRPPGRPAGQARRSAPGSSAADIRERR